MSTDFRSATQLDAPRIKEIARCVIRENYAPFLGGEAANAFIDSGMSDKEIDDGLSRCTVMFSGDEIIGYTITDGDLLHLIMVDVPHQGKGYGSRLLRHTEDEMFAMRDSIRLQTFRANTRTLEFYRTHGWAVTEEEYVPELGQTMLHLRKIKE